MADFAGFGCWWGVVFGLGLHAHALFGLAKSASAAFADLPRASRSSHAKIVAR
jgi:hypothetical protein